MEQGLLAVGQAPNNKPDESVIVKLAEHLAIRFALEQFERGEVKVNAVRQMLDRMNQEIENLRKILGSHEDKMSEAGILAESHREILDKQLWAAVPESGKRAVLLSGDAWCIPPRNVQSYVGELIEHGNIAEAISILQNYAACADSEDANARLCPEVATRRYCTGMEQTIDLNDSIQSKRPGSAGSRSRLRGIEDRVTEFAVVARMAIQLVARITDLVSLLSESTIEKLSA